jgi:hypothetical protein
MEDYEVHRPKQHRREKLIRDKYEAAMAEKREHEAKFGSIKHEIAAMMQDQLRTGLTILYAPIIKHVRKTWPWVRENEVFDLCEEAYGAVHERIWHEVEQSIGQRTPH